MNQLLINKNDIINNLNIINKINTENSKIIAVVKGNGMGLGLVKYTKFLEKNKVKMFAVAKIDEAIKLRKNGVKSDILLMTPINDISNLKILIENKIILTISTKEQIEKLEHMKIDNINAHIKIDSGFARYGFLYDNKDEILDSLRKCNKIKILGIFTHFSKPMDEKITNKQYKNFINIVNYLKNNNIDVGMVHCCESNAFVKYEYMRNDAVRLGSIIQGRVLCSISGLKKIGQVVSEIQEIKTVPKGYNISYGNMYKTKKKTKIAIIPIGYMDGLNIRKDRDIFSFTENIKSVGIEIKKFFKNNKIKVLINDKKYNIIGRIGMFHCVVDLENDYNVKIGDSVFIDINPLMVNGNLKRKYIYKGE